MVLMIYNTLSRKKEEFKARNQGMVQMFVCGPTVYDHSHIGHARSYIAFDVIAKYLRFLGYNVRYIVNITDIDDKIIHRTNEVGIAESKIAEQFRVSYMEDMDALRVSAVDEYCDATAYMKQIIVQVKKLVDKGHAYEIDDGIYFDITTCSDYGKLSKHPLDKLTQHRVEKNKQKKNQADFVLWKKHKEGEPYWDSPWGKGRPGWHIEDTAITEQEFGPQYDIHGGGIDLIFPHHEAEIAQIESVSGKKPLVNYWMHNEFIRVNGTKMSKSLNNFLTIKDALKKWNPEVLRYFFLSTHYRTPLNFTEEALDGAKNSLDRLQTFMHLLDEVTAKESEYDVNPIIKNTREAFDCAMQDDFEASKALAAIFGLVKEINTHLKEISTTDAARIKSEMMKYNEIVGVLAVKKEIIPKKIKELAQKREQARKDKDFKEADMIRKELDDKGYSIEDTDKGPRIKKNE